MGKDIKDKQTNNLKFPCLAWHAYILIAIAVLGFAMIFSKDKCSAEELYYIFLYAAFSLLLTGGVVILVMSIYQKIRFAFYCRELYRQETQTDSRQHNGSEPDKEKVEKREKYEENRAAFADYTKMLESAKVKTKTISGAGDNKVEVQEERIDTAILKEILEKKPTENQLKNNTGTQSETK